MSSISKAWVLVTFSPVIRVLELLCTTEPTKQSEIVIFDVKIPLLLDSRHPLVVLLYLNYLHKNHGAEYLMALIQQNFPIVKLRTTLWSLQSKCVTCCKRWVSKLDSMMTHLQKKCLALGYPPFTVTGLDHFGPFYVSIKRSAGKRWSFPFNCLTSRAVHLEVVPSRDTKSFVMGIDWFIYRRSVTSVI